MPQWPTLKYRPLSDIPATDPGPRQAEHELVIGDQLRFRGDLEVNADLRIEGTVRGCINAGRHTVIIEDSGLAEANIHAGSVTVRGRVLGAIVAGGTVTLEASASVEGPIHAARVVLVEGCHLAGRIDVAAEAVAS